MSPRPFIKFSGIAYPRVLNGDNASAAVRANLRDPNSYYRDEAIALSEGDLERFRGLDGKPICLEHDRGTKVGVIHHHWIDGSKRLRITGRIFTDTPEGRAAAQEVQAGRLRGLSVGYNVRLADDRSQVTGKSFHEVSLCREPFFGGCHIKVDASRKSEEKQRVTKQAPYLPILLFTLLTDSAQFYWIAVDAMSTPTTPSTTQTAPAEQPPIAPNTAAEKPQVDAEEAKELLTQADSLKEDLTKKTQESAAQSDRLRAMEAELARYRAKEAAEREAYAKEQEEKVKEVLTVFEDAYKETHKQELPEKFATGLAESFKNPDYKEPTAVMASLASKSRKLAEEKNALESRLKAMEERLLRFEETTRSATRTIEASRQSLSAAAASGDETASDAPAAAQELQVGASADDARRKQHGLKLHDFMQPHKDELPFLSHYGYMSGGEGGGVTVNASAGGSVRPPAQFPPAPEHRNLRDESGQRYFPASMRYTNPSFFNMMVARRDQAPMHLARINEKSHTLELEELK